jgi:hypothetical protein
MRIAWIVVLACGTVGAVAQAPDRCPMVIGVTANGAIFTNSFQGWFRTSMKTLETHMVSGCYPEGGPRPVSSVLLQLDPAAPQARVKAVYDALASAGWGRERIKVETNSRVGMASRGLR